MHSKKKNTDSTGLACMRVEKMGLRKQKHTHTYAQICKANDFHDPVKQLPLMMATFHVQCT